MKITLVKMEFTLVNLEFTLVQMEFTLSKQNMNFSLLNMKFTFARHEIYNPSSRIAFLVIRKSQTQTLKTKTLQI